MKTANWTMAVAAGAMLAVGLMAGAAEAQRPGRPVAPPAGGPSVSYDGGRTWIQNPRTDAFGPVIRRVPRDNRTFISDGETTITTPRPRPARPAPPAPLVAGPNRCDFYQCGGNVVAVPKGGAAPAGGRYLGDGVIRGGAVGAGNVVRGR